MIRLVPMLRVGTLLPPLRGVLNVISRSYFSAATEWFWLAISLRDEAPTQCGVVILRIPLEVTLTSAVARAVSIDQPNEKRAEAGTSQRQAAANRRNDQKSGRPRTAEGKEKSKYSALLHGEAARSPLLSDDDPVALKAPRRELLDHLHPRNWLEAIVLVLLYCAAYESREAYTNSGRAHAGIVCVL